MTNGITQKLEPFLDYKILWDFEIHTNHQILFWKSDQVLIYKKKNIICHLEDFTVQANQRVKIKESEKIDKY